MDRIIMFQSHIQKIAGRERLIVVALDCNGRLWHRHELGEWEELTSHS